MKEKIKRYLQRREIITIERKFNNKIYGMIIDFSNNLLLLRCLDNFHFDGFKVIRLQDIKNIISSKGNKFAKMVLIKEGVAFESQECQGIDLTSWEDFFKSIQKRDDFVTIVGETRDVKDFQLGKISSVDKKTLKIRGISPDGKWHGYKTIAQLSTITRANFHDEYTRMFRKYAKEI